VRQIFFFSPIFFVYILINNTDEHIFCENAQ
jgi:hypothetical protein